MSKGKPPATVQDSGAGAKQTIHTILDQFREEASSNRDLGDRFERLICRYLELDPIYVERFSRVWMWNEFPRKGADGDMDRDIVAGDIIALKAERGWNSRGCCCCASRRRRRSRAGSRWSGAPQPTAPQARRHLQQTENS